MASCESSDFYSIEDYSEVPKIDAHIHIRNDNDVFASQAIKDGFQLVNIVVDGASTWHGVRDQFHFTQLQQKRHPDLFRTIAAFSVEDFHEPGWSNLSINWMDSCFREGAIGIKVWKNIGMVLKDTNDNNVTLDDTRFDSVFNYIAQQNKILFAHQGEPFNCWLPLDQMTTNNDRSYFEEHPQYHMYQHPELPTYQQLMTARDMRLAKHPEINFVGAHMASIEWNVDTLATWLDKYPNATIDLAARMGQVFYQAQQDPQRVHNFFIKYQHRVMYATDIVDNGTAEPIEFAKRIHDTWLRDWTFFVSDRSMQSDLIEGGFNGIKLPKSAVDQIFYGTAKRVFGF
jgi:hypothetical protein